MFANQFYTRIRWFFIVFRIKFILKCILPINWLLTVRRSALYYRFNFRFCNTRSGNEKGHVERSVEIIRRKAFAHKDTFESLEEANSYLLSICEDLNSIKANNKDKSPQELFEEEKTNLLPTLGKYEAASLEMLRVDKYSTIVVNSCHYSVPDKCVNKIVKCKIYSNDIIVYFEDEKIAHHKKNPGLHQWIINIEHYFTTLSRKPHALLNSTAFKQIDSKIEQIYINYFNGKEKEFIKLLELIGQIGLEEVEKSIHMVEKITPTSVTLDKIKFVCQRNENIEFYNDYFKDKESNIINNSINMLNNYSEMLSKRKDGIG